MSHPTPTRRRSPAPAPRRGAAATALLTRSLLMTAAALLPALDAPPASADPATTEKAKAFLDDHEARLRPLEIAGNVAWWNANITGNDVDFARKEELQNRINAALADKAKFAEIKALREAAPAIDDPEIRRAIVLVHLQYVEKQVDPKLLEEMTALANKIEKAFNVYRPKVAGREVTDNEVRDILRKVRDSARLREAWESSKGVGAVVEADLKKLVALRNKAAAALGFPNFHALQVALAEQDGAGLITLFDELDELTRGPFLAAKADMEKRLAGHYGIKREELMPWHFQDLFFQEVPKVFPADVDAPYEKTDLVKLTRDFFAGVGLPVDDIIARSDLFEKKGKSPHAFCTDIDGLGDVRVLANVVGNVYWADTMLHEFGHAVYSSKFIPRRLRTVLRGEAHTLTTEGIAMMFGRLAYRRAFLEKMKIAVPEPAAAWEAAGDASLRYSLLVFSRWCQVMLRFEKSMYENPEQDLNKLWWDLVEKYQGLRRPPGRNAPDYASKIHIVSAPVYYHNYMLGELFASQVHHTIAKEVYGGAAPASVVYAGEPKVGEFLKTRVFGPGRTLPWNELTKHATGEQLSPKAFAADFQGK